MYLIIDLKTLNVVAVKAPKSGRSSECLRLDHRGQIEVPQGKAVAVVTRPDWVMLYSSEIGLPGGTYNLRFSLLAMSEKFSTSNWENWQFMNFLQNIVTPEDARILWPAGIENLISVTYAIKNFLAKEETVVQTGQYLRPCWSTVYFGS